MEDRHQAVVGQAVSALHFCHFWIGNNHAAPAKAISVPFVCDTGPFHITSSQFKHTELSITLSFSPRCHSKTLAVRNVTMPRWPGATKNVDSSSPYHAIRPLNRVKNNSGRGSTMALMFIPGYPIALARRMRLVTVAKAGRNQRVTVFDCFIFLIAWKAAP